MDVSHIITQVSRPGDRVLGTPTSKVTTESVIRSTVKRRRNILSALLCCFGNQGAAAAAASVALHTQPLPPNEAKTAITGTTTAATAAIAVTAAAGSTENSHDAVDAQGSQNLPPASAVVAAQTAAAVPAAQQTGPVCGAADSSQQPRESNGNWIVEPNHNFLETPSRYLLPKLHSRDTGKKCLVIDLDETLVHSSFKPVDGADFVVPVEIEGTVHQVFVLKRPHVDVFLQKVGELYECVLFTASLAKYADPVADILDKWGVFRSRLFRESCVFHRGNYVKDLSRLGRDLSQVIIIDNSPASYIFHPDNAVPVTSWFDDGEDVELLELCSFFEDLSRVDSVYSVLQQDRICSNVCSNVIMHSLGT